MAEYRKYQCRTCGAIYDEALGTPELGVPPGTKFEDLPEDWICPSCGEIKENFDLYED